MKRIILATGNTGKVREFNVLLLGLDVEVLPQAVLGVPEIEETGLSFVENAILKARNASRRAGLPAIADDSGLLVDGLGGAPGIHSARYAGPHASDQENLEKLLAELRCLTDPERRARFCCLLVYMRHAEDPTPLICQGTWEGVIAHAPRGENGFGYDPIFYLPSQDKTVAELPPPVKNHLSHRAQALSQLVVSLRQEYGSRH
jgi:XTP/dITP diphosphohydrolase